jgi:DNA-binding NarL/FixJ family response regulator
MGGIWSADTSTGPRPSRVVIAAGHPAIREAVRRSCASTVGLEVIGETGDADAMLIICRAELPDVVVLDDRLPDAGGLEALRRAREQGLAAAVLMLTDRSDGLSVLGALRLGVRGYLDRSDGLRRVGEAVRRVASGDRLIPAEMEQEAVMALGAFARNAREGSQIRGTLTPREREILVLISRGSTMRQAGTRLGISPRTVETHVAKLYRKLGVRTRVQAVSRAAQLGLIDL